MTSGPCGSAAVHRHVALQSGAAKARSHRSSWWRQRLHARAVSLLSGLQRAAAALCVVGDSNSRIQRGVSSPWLKMVLLRTVCCRLLRGRNSVLQHYPHRAQQAELEAGVVAFVARAYVTDADRRTGTGRRSETDTSCHCVIGQSDHPLSSRSGFGCSETVLQETAHARRTGVVVMQKKVASNHVEGVAREGRILADLSQTSAVLLSEGRPC